MKSNQRSIKSYFKSDKRRGGSSSESSGEESEYVPDNQQRKYKYPMYWSRVLDVYEVTNNSIRAWNIEDDIQKDKALQKINKLIENEPTQFLFDPNMLDAEDN